MVDDEIPVCLRDGKILNVQISSGLSPSTIVVPRSPTMRSSTEVSTEASAPTRRAEAFREPDRVIDEPIQSDLHLQEGRGELHQLAAFRKEFRGAEKQRNDRRES
jgi:hypothetical protein